jgi:hypothetical protein
LTVRPPENAPLVRRDRLAEALRTSREAVTELERQLGSLLAALRATDTPHGDLVEDDVDRLRRAASRASAAVSRIR